MEIYGGRPVTTAVLPMSDNMRPVMNNTKWSEMIDEMCDLQDKGWIIQHHAKDVHGPWPSPRGWDADFYYHLRPWNTLGAARK